MCSAIACECHQYSFGLAAFDGYNNRLARSKETATGCTDGHITSPVVGDNHREFAIGSQQAGSTAGQLVETERIGVASHRACRIGTLERILEEGGIAENGIERQWAISLRMIMLRILHYPFSIIHYPLRELTCIGLQYLYAITPGRCRNIFSGLSYGISIEVNGHDISTATLGSHKCHKPSAGTHIEDMIAMPHACPRTE